MKNFINRLYQAFETRKRLNGNEFVALKHDEREEFSLIVRDMHGTEFMPDDFRYKTIEAILSSILDVVRFSDDDDFDLQDVLEDARHEIVDGLVDIYNADLTTWLNSSLRRASYVDEAVDEFGTHSGGIFDTLKMGQYKEIDEIYSNISNALVEVNNEIQTEKLANRIMETVGNE